MLAALEIAQVFSAAECTAIIKLANNQRFDDAGLVLSQQDSTVRRARITWLDENAEAKWIFDRIVHTVIETNRQHFKLDLDEFAERMQVSSYSADKAGHFDWHIDTGTGPLAAKRKLTIVVQLSDGDSYLGGALETNADGQVRAAPREIGTALLFPSFTLHRVTPVTAGERYSLTTWVHGPAFR